MESGSEHSGAARQEARPVRAAIAYWAMVFALGFLLGTVRVLWGAEALGEDTFVLIELPIMLCASWLAARWLVRRFGITSTRQALAMGALAFLLLMIAELALTAATGGSPLAWLRGLMSPPHLYGFAGQVAFGLMPLLVLRRSY